MAERSPDLAHSAEAAGELRETEPQPGDMVVDLVRHGESQYTGIAPDLTEKGQAQVLEYSRHLVPDIDPEKDVVVLWHSPQPRAEGTADIIRGELENAGRRVAKQKIVPTLRQLGVNDPEKIDAMFDRFVAAGMTEDEMMKQEEFYDPTHAIVEGADQMAHRANRLLHGLNYAFNHVDPGESRLRIVGVSHFEILQPILEEMFQLEPGKGVQKAEGARLVFHHTGEAPPRDTSVSVEFRGQTAGPFRLDPATRTLVPFETEPNG